MLQLLFKWNKLKYKFNKAGEFWRMYLTWCKVFNEQSEKLFKEKYEKQI